MRRILIMMVMILGAGSVRAQSFSNPSSFLDNWYFQGGVDVSLQKPYSYEFSDSFKEGSSWGIDLAAGKWFTPEIGARIKLNWENGIPLFGKNRANWLGPFFDPGKNMERGGYLIFSGDVQLDIHNLFFGYDPDRKWNMQIYPGAGIAYNFGVTKGSPLIALGWGNTFKINDKIKVYADVEFNGVSSGFVGDESAYTGVGNGFNAFLDANVGVQINLGRGPYGFRRDFQAGTSFWHNWFLQAGLDMTLNFPYNKDYSEVMTKGRTFGIVAAAGKYFSPELAVRGRIDWENGFPLFRNDKLEWVGTDPESTRTNMQAGGNFTLAMDVMLDVLNIIRGYMPGKAWSPYVFARAGIGYNMSLESSSPLVGAGLGISRRINERISVFADTCYQMITSEFFTGVDGSITGMDVSTGHNAFMDFSIGVQWNLKNK